MGWQKRMHVSCSPIAISKFNETEFAVKILPICGHVLGVHKKVHDGRLIVSIIFPDKQAARFDQTMLTEITSELLDEEVKLYIEDGGVGTL